MDVQRVRAVADAEEKEQERAEAALEGEIQPIQTRLQSSYIVLGRAAIESEEAAKDALVAEENDVRVTKEMNEAEVALQVARQELAPLSGQLQSLAKVEVALRQNTDSLGDQPDMSKVAQSADFGDEIDVQRADAQFKSTKSSLAKLERRWQNINSKRTALHHKLQEKVTRLASDAEEFQATLHGVLSADLNLLNGLHGLGTEEISCNSAREDLSRIQGYLTQLQQKKKNMKATVNQLKGKVNKNLPLAKLLHVSESADKEAIRLVESSTAEPGNNVANSALEDRAVDALGNLEAKARSLEQKIAKLEAQKLIQAPMDFKLQEDRTAEPALTTAVLHAKSAAEKACQTNVNLARFRSEARNKRGEARVFGDRVAATERTVYGIQHDLATLGENRRKQRKELHFTRNKTITLAEDVGRLSEASRMVELLRAKEPWEVEESIANERVELEGKLTQKQVAVHERERVLSDLQSEVRQSQVKLEKALKGVSAGKRAMQKAKGEVRDLEKQLNHLRKKLQKQSPLSKRGQVSMSSAAVSSFRGKHHSSNH